MVLHVILLGTYSHSPPTRNDLLYSLRKHSQRSYHATSSYLWTEDNLFSNLTPLPLPETLFSSGTHRCGYYAFEAYLSLGGNDEDTRVTAMMLLDLTEAIQGLTAAVTESEGTVKGEEEEEEETDVLLLELADIIEHSEGTRGEYLSRWGAEEYDYHQRMVGRVIMMGGSVFVVPLRPNGQLRPRQKSLKQQSLRDKCYERLEPLLTLLEVDDSVRKRFLEEEMTEALQVWAHRVASTMREGSWHLAVVAVPAPVAELVDKNPTLARAALLHHTARQPLHWLRNGALAPTQYSGAESIVRGVVEEYRMLTQSGCYVRVPLRIPRYIFAHLHCSAAPPSLISTPLCATTYFPQQRSASGGDESCVAVEATEEELLHGLQLTIALQRLRREVAGPHAAVIESFLKDVKKGGGGNLQESNESGEDIFSQRYLCNLRRKVMNVPTLRSHSTSWLYAYAQEAERLQTLTGDDVNRLDDYLFNDGASACSGSDNTTESNEEETGRSHAVYPSERDETDVLLQLKEMEHIMELSTREAVLGGSGGERSELKKVASNALFLNTVHMLSQDSSL
ncbi:hypothetical protein, conserved [Trypanosoma brucei gambiense DAL972]|uniref:Uncharacterized protein n=2 Tax=Trypanosoma brucei TaxID=5691 RepID=C9ZR13_TRYB9|nr:hypothetical protein, conserved [Trypanosoma brucei gambiense DAL972]CBH11843.1 hypothetical protein, conserved [Trypanosoma brucei gambiense DAL972]|eukprot:XP_011774128.1 hypothetical protein, conserved [Trypanosoma brucei gambiense DAL972]